MRPVAHKTNIVQRELKSTRLLNATLEQQRPPKTKDSNELVALGMVVIMRLSFVPRGWASLIPCSNSNSHAPRHQHWHGNMPTCMKFICSVSCAFQTLTTLLFGFRRMLFAVGDQNILGNTFGITFNTTDHLFPLSIFYFPQRNT